MMLLTIRSMSPEKQGMSRVMPWKKPAARLNTEVESWKNTPADVGDLPTVSVL